MAKNDSKSTPTRSVEDVMEETVAASFIVRHKFQLIVLVTAGLLTLVGLGVYSNYKEDENARLAQIIHIFKTTYYKSFESKKIDAPTFMKKLNELESQVGDFEGIISILISASDIMVKNSNLNEAKMLLEKGRETFSGNGPWVKHFILSRLATVYEDLGKKKEAIDVLEELNRLGPKIMEGKVYLDLGRLYLETGDKKKAKLNLSYVIEKFAHNNFDKMAKLYLMELKAGK